ncbi:MAG: hypothetical protein V7640_1499 [Betaproteobacteria bacterium]
MRRSEVLRGRDIALVGLGNRIIGRSIATTLDKVRATALKLYGSDRAAVRQDEYPAEAF